MFLSWVLKTKNNMLKRKRKGEKNPQLTRVASKRTATPCFPPDRPTASGRSSDCHSSLNVQKKQNKGPIKGGDRKKANGRRKGTLHGQVILTLTKTGSWKKLMQ